MLKNKDNLIIDSEIQELTEQHYRYEKAVKEWGKVADKVIDNIAKDQKNILHSEKSRIQVEWDSQDLEDFAKANGINTKEI